VPEPKPDPTPSNPAASEAEAEAGEYWKWCPRCGHELENQKCKFRCPRCHYFMSCSDFD
jgi:Zn finger protein HypA/HybF involved in hydrogenase expression